ncbi:UNVERIFIED_CONTAM: hypothetical protein FKN15_077571 [Acipenser sinensis]
MKAAIPARWDRAQGRDAAARTQRRQWEPLDSHRAEQEGRGTHKTLFQSMVTYSPHAPRKNKQ